MSKLNWRIVIFITERLERIPINLSPKSQLTPLYSPVWPKKGNQECYDLQSTLASPNAWKKDTETDLEDTA